MQRLRGQVCVCVISEQQEPFNLPHREGPTFQGAKESKNNTNTLQYTHTLLATSFLFNECQTAHPNEESHGRKLKEE